jgi:hypothetical protein
MSPVGPSVVHDPTADIAPEGFCAAAKAVSLDNSLPRPSALALGRGLPLFLLVIFLVFLELDFLFHEQFLDRRPSDRIGRDF